MLHELAHVKGPFYQSSVRPHDVSERGCFRWSSDINRSFSTDRLFLFVISSTSAKCDPHWRSRSRHCVRVIEKSRPLSAVYARSLRATLRQRSRLPASLHYSHAGILFLPHIISAYRISISYQRVVQLCLVVLATPTKSSRQAHGRMWLPDNGGRHYRPVSSRRVRIA